MKSKRRKISFKAKQREREREMGMEKKEQNRVIEGSGATAAAVVRPVHNQVRRIKQEDEKMIEERFKHHVLRHDYRRASSLGSGRHHQQRSRSPLGPAGRVV